MQGNLKAFRIALMLVLSLFIGTVSAQTVTGNVVDETGEAVIGATVLRWRAAMFSRFHTSVCSRRMSMSLVRQVST